MTNPKTWNTKSALKVDTLQKHFETW